MIIIFKGLFFCWNNRFLKGLGRSNLYDGLGGNLNFFTCNRVPAFASLSFDENGFPDAWENEGPFLLGLAYCYGCEFINNGGSSLLGELEFLGKIRADSETPWILQACEMFWRYSASSIKLCFLLISVSWAVIFSYLLLGLLPTIQGVFDHPFNYIVNSSPSSHKLDFVLAEAFSISQVRN